MPPVDRCGPDEIEHCRQVDDPSSLDTLRQSQQTHFGLHTSGQAIRSEHFDAHSATPLQNTVDSLVHLPPDALSPGAEEFRKSPGECRLEPEVFDASDVPGWNGDGKLCLSIRERGGAAEGIDSQDPQAYRKEDQGDQSCRHHDMAAILDVLAELEAALLYKLYRPEVPDDRPLAYHLQ